MKAPLIYLDYAAATPMHPEVQAAMQPYFAEAFYNPSALYGAAIEVRKAVDKARADVAAVFGVRASELVFTAGGTEANNLAIHGVMSQFKDKKALVLEIEHDSVLHPIKPYNHELIPVDIQGIVLLDKLEELLDDEVVFVSIGLVNNEIGTIQPLREAAAIIERVRRRRQESGNSLPLYFHTDACQAGNYLSLQTHRLGVDMMTINGGKLYGPKQSGALYVRAGIEMRPLIAGGGQERGLRSGTENVAQIVGLACAVELAQMQRNDRTKQAEQLRELFIAELTDSLPQAIINGSRKSRIANNVHITIPGADNERVLMALDEQGIACAVGSACSASSDEPSHVLKAIGLDDAAAQSSLRFTIGNQTTEAMIKTVVKQLSIILK